MAQHCPYCGALSHGRYACYAHTDIARIEAAMYRGSSRPPMKGKGSFAMQEDKVEAARNLGLTMGSRFKGAVIGWTTNEALAGKAAELGLQVNTCYNRTGPAGWEVVALPDPPVEAENVTTSGKG